MQIHSLSLFCSHREKATKLCHLFLDQLLELKNVLTREEGIEKRTVLTVRLVG